MIAYSYIFVKEKQGLISIRSEKKHKLSLQSISKYTADENFQTYTDQNHAAQYLRFARQLCSEFTADEQSSNTDNKCDSCNDQGTDQSHQPVIFSNRKAYGQCVNRCGYPLDHQCPKAHAGFLLLTVPGTDTLIDHMSADISQQDKRDPAIR